jgi:serine/threonine protein kinase
MDSDGIKKVACKQIDVTKLSSNYKFKFLPRETSICRRLSHPNIISFYGSFILQDDMYMFIR